MKINYLQEVELNKRNHQWYGGDVVEIVYSDNVTFIISAIGDVIGNIYEGGKSVARFRDKNNNGAFNDVVSQYIKDDAKLEEAANYDYINEEYLQENKDKEYVVNFTNCNWWEVFPVVDGKVMDIMQCLDASTIDDAIQEVLNNSRSILNYLGICS